MKLIVAILLLGVTAGLAAAASPSALEVLRAVQAREAQITQLSGRAVQHVLVREDGALVSEPSATVPPTQGSPLALQTVLPGGPEGLVALRFRHGDGKFRYDVWKYRPLSQTFLGTYFEAPAGPRFEQWAANGDLVTRYKSSVGSASLSRQETWPKAVNSAIAQQLALALMTGSIGDCLALAVEPPLGSEQGAYTYTAWPEEDVRGLTCVGLTLAVDLEGQPKWTHRLWLAPERGWAAVRLETTQEALPNYPAEQRIVNCLDFDEVQPGLWLPTFVVEERYQEEGGEKTLISRGTWSFTDLSVAPIQEHEYAIDIPPGVLIQGTNGLSVYTRGQGLSDDLLRDARRVEEKLLGQALSLTPSPEEPNKPEPAKDQ